MPQPVVITICTAVILVAIGIIAKREGERRRRAIRAMGENRPPELICIIGSFRFRWVMDAPHIDMYLIVGMNMADRLIGTLETVTPEGNWVSYNWNPFNDWCKRVVGEMAKAEITDAPAPGTCRDCSQPLHQRHTPECPRNQARPGERPDEVRLPDCPPPPGAMKATANDPKREHRGGC